MTDAARLRDSTEIQLAVDTYEGIETELQERFDVTIHRAGDQVRLIASPVVIRDVSEFLARHGVNID